MPIVTPEEARAAREEAERERAFWQEHFQDYLAKYRDRFVVVKDGEVILATSDLEALANTLRDKGQDAGSLWARYISEPRELIL